MSLLRRQTLIPDLNSETASSQNPLKDEEVLLSGKLIGCVMGAMSFSAESNSTKAR
jgi:hypothetical protein